MKRVNDSISTREAFGDALVQMGEKYPDLIYLAADTLKSVGGTKMHAMYPKRALNVGIGEQNMALMGVGLASCGAKVVLAGYAVFSTLRMLEQVRTFICYPNLDIKIVAGLSGLSGGQEGVTHQGVEDIASLRSIPNLVIVSPADAASTEIITRKIIDYKGPVYMRLGRTPTEKVFDENYSFEIGKANVLLDEGADATVFVTGLVTGRVLAAAEQIKSRGYSVRVVEMPCIKPLDIEAVLKAARETNVVITVEDHQITGGLGSAVAEVLAESGTGVLTRIGVPDCFTESGNYEELLDKYGFSPGNIVDVVVQSINKKKGGPAWTL